MPRFRFAFFALTFAALPAAMLAAGVEVLSLEPTALFPRREPLAQIARLTVVNTTGAPVRAQAVISIRDGATETTSDLELLPRQTTVDVLVPDIASASELRLELRSEGSVVVSHTQTWQPQRKWKVHLIKASHEDIGYENYIFQKQKEIADFIDLAHDQASPRSVAGNIGTSINERTAFRYTLETILFQRNYIDERGERAWRKLVESDIKPGHMSIAGAPSGVHTHWMDYEVLARQSYPARRESRDRFGLDIQTYMIVDNPSLSWSGAQALADSGFKYVARWGQGWRTGGNNDYATTKLPALFWWQGPNGKSRVLFGWRSHYAMGFWFGQTGTYRSVLDLAGNHVSDFLRSVEAGKEIGPYPYDALVSPEYIDHDIPKHDKRTYEAWHAKYAFPDIRVTSPDAFFSYIEEKYGDTLPVLSGDLGNFSADYSAIDPVSQGWKRRASRLLPVTEGLGVVAGLADPSFSLSVNEIERTYTRMFDYDEHCWPTLPRATDQQLFNAAWVKQHEARRALDATTRLFDEAASALGRHIAAPGGAAFAVFNPLAHARSDLVEIEGAAAAVVDLRNNTVIPTEPAGRDRVRFLAPNVPAFGYSVFQLQPSATPVPAAGELAAGPLSIENRFYAVRFHPENGAVVSIVDKTTGRELIDASAPYLANQIVYVHKTAREAKDGFEYMPAKATRLEPRIGRTQVSFDVWIDDAKLGGRIHQTVTLHAGVKRVEFASRLESIDVMHSMVYEDRYRDNLFIAFPFAVPDGQIRAEQAGGVVRPYDDQLRWGTHDYLSVNQWIDVSNAQGGVTLASREASTFHLGEIRYNQFSIDYKPTKPWLFCYAWSNRMAGLLTLQNDDCNAEFHFSLTSGDGDWDTGRASRLGWETASPLEAFPVTGSTSARWRNPEQSFLKVDHPNVQLTVLKAAGQVGRGWVARFAETDGRATEFEVDVSALGVTSATLANLVEDDAQPLAVRNGKVRIKILPFGFATVRLAAGEAPVAVAKLSAESVTDSAVRLTWSGPSAPAYEVYRSDDPDAPATVYTRVARTTTQAFEDSDLHLGTHYTYRVAAVSAANLQGPLSEPLTVRTAEANRSAPAPVHELGVVRRSPDTLIVYWRKHPEPDVARYRLFRGDTPDFPIEGREPHAILDANAYFLQIFRDTGLEPGRTYYYRVQPVDWAANVQPESPVAGAATPKDSS